MIDKNDKRFHRIIQAGTWTALVYATLPVAPRVTALLREYTSFSLLVNGLILAGFLAVTGLALCKGTNRRWLTCLMLALVFGAYLAGIRLVSNAAERLHFIEYGFLSFLVYRVFQIDFSPARAYGFAFAVTLFLSAVDEGIQHLLPNRYYELRDIVINGVSIALGLALVFAVKGLGYEPHINDEQGKGLP